VSSEYNDEDPSARIERAHREIRAQAAGLRERPRLGRADMPAAEPAERLEPARLAYSLGDLTGSNHRSFVEAAFRALLKRAPERGETEVHLARLAAGARKVEILGDLRWAPEGRRVGVHVSGLRARYLLAKGARVPVLGYLLDLCLDVASLPLQPRHQRALETALAARDEAIQETLQGLNGRIGTLVAQIRTLAEQAAARATQFTQHIEDLHATVHQHALARDALERKLHAIETVVHMRIEATEKAIEEDRRIGERHRERLDELEFIRQRFYAINHWTHSLEGAFAQIEEVARMRDGELAIRAATLAVPALAEPGRARDQQPWDDAFARMLPMHAAVLAFTCDRDWIERLARRGFVVVHAEPNPVLAEAARIDGVVVESVSAKELLRRTPDGCVDGISVLAASSVVGTLPLVELLDEAARVLRANGVLLLADAHGVATLVDDLLGVRTDARIDALPAPLFHAAGFAEVHRVDADGSVAWLLQRTVA
jgi:hypothetical protein